MHLNGISANDTKIIKNSKNNVWTDISLSDKWSRMGTTEDTVWKACVCSCSPPGAHLCAVWMFWLCRWGFPPQSKVRQVGLIRDSKLPVGVNVKRFSVSMSQPCALLPTNPLMDERMVSVISAKFALNMYHSLPRSKKKNIRHRETYSKKFHNRLGKAHHIHGNSHGVGEGKDQTNRASELWTETPWNQIVRSTWKQQVKKQLVRTRKLLWKSKMHFN